MESQPVEKQATTQEQIAQLMDALKCVSGERDLLQRFLSDIRTVISRHDEALEAAQDPWLEILEKRLDKNRVYTMRMILVECMNLQWEGHTRSKTSRLRNCLRKLGWYSVEVQGMTRLVSAWKFRHYMPEVDDSGVLHEIPVGPLGKDAGDRLRAFLNPEQAYCSKDLLTAVFDVAPGYKRQTRERLVDLANHMRRLGWKSVLRRDARKKVVRVWVKARSENELDEFA